MSDRDDRSRYVLLVVATVLAGVAGYAGYLLYPRFGLPPISGASVFVLASAAAFAAFFSPCSFPLLVTLLARASAGDEEPRGRRLSRTLVFATSLSAGAVTFVATVGAFFALGGHGLAAAVTFTSTSGRIIRAVVGVVLVALGLVQSGHLRANLRRFEPTIHGYLKRQARLRRRRPIIGTALFGFGYLAAGFG